MPTAQSFHHYCSLRHKKGFLGVFIPTGILQVNVYISYRHIFANELIKQAAASPLAFTQELRLYEILASYYLKRSIDISLPGYRWQQNWRTSKRKIGLLCLLPVDGVIQLLHLLISEDAIGEIWLELLQVQLPIIWKERCLWKLHLAEASVFQHLNEEFAHNRV